MMHVLEADREGVDWNKYDLVICGAPVLYGVFRKQFLAFVNRWKAVLDAKPNSFFNVTVIARNPAKATPEATSTAASSLRTTRGTRRTSSASPAKSTTRTGAGSTPSSSR